MQDQSVDTILASVAAQLPPARRSGRVLSIVPDEHVLRGFLVEDSSDPTAGYVWVFVQPFFVPASTVVLSLGKRLNGGTRFSEGDAGTVAQAAVSEGLPFLASVDDTPRTIADWAHLSGSTNHYAVQSRAYALILLDQAPEAAELLRALEGRLDSTIRWQRDVRERVREMATLASTDRAAALARLAQWERETREVLGLR
jgi:hypothetical protein